jgi:hypothetical protein
MKRHLMMLLGCTLPMLLLVVLPTLGISNGVTVALFIVMMLGCHLFMGGCGGHREPREPHDRRG